MPRAKKRSRPSLRISGEGHNHAGLCKPAPRMVVVATAILSIQGRLAAINRREDTLDAEYERLDEEKNTKVTELSTLQREMDKLTSTHHVVQQ